MKLSFHLVSIVFLTLFIAGNVHSWPSAIDWADDIVVQTNSIHSCTAADANFQGPPSTYPEECHRWNLVWSMDGTLTNSDGNYIELSVTLNPQIDWVPDRDNSMRLPTIKELVRLFTYKNSAGIQDPLIRKWLSLGCEEDQAADDGILCNNVAITLRDKSSSTSFNTTKEAYLISSTYRDYDGRTLSNNNRVQVLGVRISDGKVVAFEPGGKGNWFDNYAQTTRLALCEGFETGSAYGDCEYQTAHNENGGIEHTLSADRSVVPIYALLVRETPLN